MRTCVRVLYAELHSHSAFSFLDGASLPDELGGRGGRARLRRAGADRPRLRLAARWSSPRRPRALGLRAIHGAEIDSRRTAAHLTLLVEDAHGLAQPVPDPHARARAHARARQRAAAARAARDDRGARRGPRLPERLRAPGRPRRADAAPAAGRLRARRLRVELQRPFQRHDRTLNRGAGRAGGAARGPVRGHGQRPRARALARAAAGRVRGAAPPHDARRLRARAPRQLRRTCSPRRRRWPRASRTTRTRSRRRRALADRLRFDLSPGPRLPLPGLRGRGRRPRAGRAVLRRRFDERYPPGQPAPRRGARAAGGGAAGDRRRSAWPASSCCTATCSSSRARWRSRCAGRDDGARAAAARAAGAAPRVSSIVCYLTGLSHIDPVENELFLGRFLNEELTALPDIDLDFPRDIREVLIPRVHERYGRERSALVAAFPTFRSRGAIRELGKVLGLPPGEIERVARGAEPWAVRRRRRSRRPAWRWARQAGRPAGRWAWLVELCDEAYGLPRHLSQHSGGDDRLDPPADRLLPRAAGGDGGPPAVPVGQGLLRGRGLPEDRPARARDALGGRALRGARSRARAASASTSRGSRSTTPTTYAAIQDGGHDGRLPDRDPRADGSRCSARGRETLDDLTIQVAIVRPGPILGGAVNPYIARRSALREDPGYVVPYEHPSLEPVLRDTLGTIIFQDQVIEVAMAFAGFSPGEAEGLRRAMSRKRSDGGDRGLPPALRRGRGAHARRRRGAGRARLRDDRRLLGLRLPEGPRRRVRAARLPVDLAARALRARVPVRAAQRAADGLLPVRHARPRGPAARDRGAARPTSTTSEVECTVDRRRARCGSGSATCSACARDEVRRARGRARGRAGRSARWATSPRARGRGGRRWRSSPGRGRATRWPAIGPAAGDRRPRRAVAARGRRARGATVRRGHPARAAARRPGARRSCASSRLGGDGRRLRDDRADARRAPDGAAAPARCRRARSPARDLERLRARDARARSADWSSPASGPGPRRGSSSCCSRTSSGRST